MRITREDSENYQHAFGSIDGLAEVARRLTQEVEVLKTMLRDKGVWDEPTYKQAIVDRFIADHNSTGISSERHHSHYPYALKESSFLKYRFNATDEEIAAFEQKVDEVSAFRLQALSQECHTLGLTRTLRQTSWRSRSPN